MKEYKELRDKVAEWAGFEKRYSGLYPCVIESWFTPSREVMEELPNFPESLGACFKWLVPKAIEVLKKDTGWDEKGCLNRIFIDWRRIYWNSKGVLSFAHSLCLAIEKLIDKEEQCQ